MIYQTSTKKDKLELGGGKSIKGAYAVCDQNQVSDLRRNRNESK
jgi:hypothetical protein